jgi:hypothetical protein
VNLSKTYSNHVNFRNNSDAAVALKCMVDVAIQQNVRALGNLQKKNSSASTRAKGLGPPKKKIM